jgi:hypothetical protein
MPALEAPGALQDFAQRRAAVENGMLRIELDRQFEAALAADVGSALHVLDRLLLRGDVLTRRAHHQRAVQRHRIVAGDYQVGEQPRALLAVRENPAVFAAEGADGYPGGADQVQHRIVGQSLFIAALEIGAPQFHGVETAVARGVQRCV